MTDQHLATPYLAGNSDQPRCHWVREVDGTTTLIPGCWNRVHNPDAECGCGEWCERTAREKLRNSKAMIYRLAGQVEDLRAALSRAGIEYPAADFWKGSTARARRRAMHKAISEAGKP